MLNSVSPVPFIIILPDLTSIVSTKLSSGSISSNLGLNLEVLNFKVYVLFLLDSLVLNILFFTPYKVNVAISESASYSISPPTMSLIETSIILPFSATE